MKELNYIQTQLNVPKNQKNQFGNYNYRSLEDITEAVKPLLLETNCTLTFSDRVVMIGTPFVCKDIVDMGHEEGKNWIPDIREIETVKGVKFYLVATATLTNAAGETAINEAWAEHPETKKGMDPAQLTGATSSYARKYAACGLFAIDDNRDPDVTNDGSHHDARRPNAPARQSHAPKAPAQNQAPVRNQAPAQNQAPVRNQAPAQNQAPADKRILFLQKMGVEIDEVEDALGKRWADLDEKDNAFLRNVIKIMQQNPNMPFYDAVERQCIVDADANVEGAAQ